MTYISTLWRGVGRPEIGILRRVRLMAMLHRQRKALADLDAARLADIGLTAQEAQAEAARLPWDAPSHWLRCR